MRKYKSKIGLELAIPLLVVFGFTIFSLINENKGWIPMIAIISIFSFIAYLFLNTYYIIDKQVLTIRSGFLYNLKIDIFDIKKIEETRNPISSPAVSLDRLEIYYGKFNSIVISPKDKHAFIEEITRINANIEVKYRAK